jgi:hypothetical protein
MAAAGTGDVHLICVLLDLAWLQTLPRTAEATQLPMLEQEWCGVVWAFRSKEQREIGEDERKDFGCG